MSETIFALSSAPGKAGVGVVRVSGPEAFSSLRSLTQLQARNNLRRAMFASVRDRDDGLIDRALIIPFAGPASFTGEDVVEYHVHGSPAVVSALSAALAACGHRMAEPGEFTRRAFENGKLDLTEAEAVADLINAETQIQREQALAQMGGALSVLYEGWRARLIRIMAYVEAIIDFPDEDVPDSETSAALPELAALKTEIEAHLNDNRRGERLRSGIRVSIVGAPNAGKSSLLNLLAQRDVAIVSPVAGTTRDVLEAHLDIAGYPVILSDTAGLRMVDPDTGGHDAIEYEGMKRARDRAADADIVILMFDGTHAADDQTLSLRDDRSILVYNKSDAPGFKNEDGGVPLSARTGDGLPILLEALSGRIRSVYDASRATPSLTRARHRQALETCVSLLDEALTSSLPELMAEDTRMAARALGRITGRIDVEDLLDVIFRDFCIGK